MKISELISHLQNIKETYGDLHAVRHVEYDESDPESEYEAYTYAFSQPIVIQAIEQNYGEGYTELLDVTGEENIYNSKKVVVLS